MFGLGDSGQAQNDDPAMLDNVAKLASQPADHVEPPQLPTSSQPTVSASMFQTSAPADPASGQTQTAAVDDNSSTVHIAQPAFDFNDQTTPVQVPTPPTQEPAEQSQIDGMPDFGSVSSPVDASSATDTSVQENIVDFDSTPLSTQIEDSSSQPEINKDHLAGMKQEALEHLEPLVGHLDQSPEETFRTTMMMIQANDNHTLIEKALQAARQIADDKARAQAMLDIINEINYFTQSDTN